MRESMTLAAPGRQMLDYLPVGLFGSVMGLTGLSVAWRLAQAQYGIPGLISPVIAAIAVLAFVALLTGYRIKLATAPEAVRAEFRHPIAGILFGTMSISLLLLPIVVGPYQRFLAQALWITGAVRMILFAWFVVSRWLSDRQQVAHAALHRRDGSAMVRGMGLTARGSASMMARNQGARRMQDPYCHSSSIAVGRPAQTAFAIMSEGLQQGRWTWGSFDRVEVEPDLFLGTSVFTGERKYVRLDVDPARLLVDYAIGPRPDTLKFRNMSRVIPGGVLGLDPAHSVVTLLTWRISSQSSADWEQFCCIHEAEMFLIKGLLER